jgi:hypothetical protein
MSTPNEIWLAQNGHAVRLDLDEETTLLPSFQANDRTKPDTIQSDYSPEFSVPGSAHNQRLLGHAAASQPTQSQAYARLPCVLTSAGVETLPLGILLIKGFKEGRYQLQLLGGNRRFVEALGEKKLSDLDFSRFDHDWTPAIILAALPFDYWQQFGWGYEVYERGKPLDLSKLDPYTLYPSVAAWLVLKQIVADAGFTADSLRAEPLFAAENVPAANPYEYPQKYRDDRQLTAGYFFPYSETTPTYLRHTGAFAQENLNFGYTERKPYHLPAPGTATYFGGLYRVDTLGYYDIAASIPTFFGCNDKFPGKVRVKFMLLVNGQHIFDTTGAELGKDEEESGKYITKTFNPKLSRYLLKPGDTVQLVWRGDEIGGGLYSINPNQPRWAIGPYGNQVDLHNGLFLSSEVRFTVTLLPDFPPGGRVRLGEWLPDMKQLDFVKSQMLLGGLTIQTDAYEPHLHLATGAKLLANVPAAKDWTAKRDSFAQPGRLQERDLSFRFGFYGQQNYLKWTEDEHVTTGYGDGVVTVADAVLPATADLATLPFAATEASPEAPGLLRILNFDVVDFTASPIVYTTVQAKPRLTLRTADRAITGNLIMVPAKGEPSQSGYVPPVLQPFTSTASYFADVAVSLLLNGTVLTEYWADLRAMLDQARYLTERYRLTAQDIAELDFSVPIWDGLLNDYFAVSQVSEFDPRRPTEVKLCRVNAAHLGAPRVPALGAEFWEEEFYTGEFY